MNLRLEDVHTPAYIIDVNRLRVNIDRMDLKIGQLGVMFRPHVKTSKCIDIVRMATASHSGAITVSTLREAEYFFAAGFHDILYAVAIAPDKLGRAANLVRLGADLKVVVDSVATAQALVEARQEHAAPLSALIEIDCDRRRSGVDPESRAFLDIAQILTGAGALRGVMTYGGSAYGAYDKDAIAAIAEREHRSVVGAADRLRDKGLTCEIVSLGNSFTVMAARYLPGVTEVRAGAYMLLDLTMKQHGICSADDIAGSVLATVVGYNPNGPWLIVDAGGLALSKDQGDSITFARYGYGMVCDVTGQPIPGLFVGRVSQEHGMISSTGHSADLESIAIGTKLRIVTNHACMTAAAYDRYHVVGGTDTSVVADWPRCNGW